MVRPCPLTLALPSAFAWGVKWAGKTRNIFLELSSQTAGTFTEKKAAPGTAAFEGDLYVPGAVVYPAFGRDASRAEAKGVNGATVKALGRRNSKLCLSRHRQ